MDPFATPLEFVPEGRLSLLRCLKCGNTVEVKPLDLLQLSKTGWLKCCGEEMTLFQATRKPAPAPRIPPKQ